MKRIIYVEDDNDTAQAVKDILESSNYKVDIALTGKEGLKKIKSGEYALALIDIMLPDMSGWDIFQKVKGMKMKFSFLSALTVSPERLTELKNAGLNDYITKPFTAKDLTARVNKMLK